MTRKHGRCLYDCCNFYGRNGGAWADLWGDDLVIFGGMWHGDCTNNRKGATDSPFTWLPGAGPSERSVDRLSDGEVYFDVTYHYSICFGAFGDVAALVRRFDEDGPPEPQDFGGCELLARDMLTELTQDQNDTYKEEIPL